MEQIINLNINREHYEVIVGPRESLADVLRNKLDLSEAEENCDEEGYNEYLEVIMDGMPVNAWLVRAAEAEGEEILTAGYLEKGSCLHPLHDGYMWLNGFQCGFCASGMLMSAKALFDENRDCIEKEMQSGMLDDLCC
jgi:aerobic-type carbon monoxide dehydrogenase small subunit (CoxS/CutS family)